jgi:hypothetical protein
VNTLSRGSNRIDKAAAVRHASLRTVLLYCGILSSLVYAALTVVGALSWRGYSSVTQYVSEFSAIGAPSRPFVVPFMFAYSVLMVAFGVGVWCVDSRKPALHVLAALLVGYGVICLAGPFTPMHMLGTAQTLTDTLHVVGAVLDVLLIFLIIGFGAAVFGVRFRLYSIASIIVFFVFGALGVPNAPWAGTHLFILQVGVAERIVIYGYLIWVVVLAVGLLHAQAQTALPSENSEPGV